MFKITFYAMAKQNRMCTLVTGSNRLDKVNHKRDLVYKPLLLGYSKKGTKQAFGCMKYINNRKSNLMLKLKYYTL